MAKDKKSTEEKSTASEKPSTESKLGTKEFPHSIVILSAGRMNLDKETLTKLVLTLPNDNPDAEIPVADVLGMAIAAEPKTSPNYDNNDYIEFKGRFRGQNLVTKKWFRSGKLILPSILEGEIAAMVEASDAAQIAMRLTVRKNVRKDGALYMFAGQSFVPDDGYFDEVSKMLEAPEVDPAQLLSA